MSTRRITVQEVQAAYAKTGFKAVRRSFIRREGANGEVCLCGLSAVAVASEAVHFLAIEEADDRLDFIAHALGIDWQYANEFTDGFDCNPTGLGPLEQHIGYVDGRAAAAAVFPEAAK